MTFSPSSTFNLFPFLTYLSNVFFSKITIEKNNNIAKYRIEYTVLRAKYAGGKLVNVPITSLILSASNGGKSKLNILIAYTPIWLSVAFTKSMRREKLWPSKYTITVTKTVSIVDINVEKKNTSPRVISSLRKVNRSENSIIASRGIDFAKHTHKNTSDWKRSMTPITHVNQRNFPRIKSHLLIGFERIRKIVFPSISLNSSWLQTNSTVISPNISIIASQKSTITLLFSHRDNCPSAIEKRVKIIAKKTITYKSLFLMISLKVFCAIFIIKFF